MDERKPKYENPITRGPITEATAARAREFWTIVTEGDRVAATQVVIDLSEIIQFAVDALSEVAETKTIGAAKHVSARALAQIRSHFEIT